VHSERLICGDQPGKLQPIIDKVFLFERIVDAHHYLESNQQSGKIVVTVWRRPEVGICSPTIRRMTHGAALAQLTGTRTLA